MPAENLHCYCTVRYVTTYCTRRDINYKTTHYRSSTPTLSLCKTDDAAHISPALHFCLPFFPPHTQSITAFSRHSVSRFDFCAFERKSHLFILYSWDSEISGSHNCKNQLTESTHFVKSTQSLSCNVEMKWWCITCCQYCVSYRSSLERCSGGVEGAIWQAAGSDGFDRAGIWYPVDSSQLAECPSISGVPGDSCVSVCVWKLHGGSHCSVLWLEVRPFHQLTTTIFLALPWASFPPIRRDVWVTVRSPARESGDEACGVHIYWQNGLWRGWQIRDKCAKLHRQQSLPAILLITTYLHCNRVSLHFAHTLKSWLDSSSEHQNVKAAAGLSLKCQKKSKSVTNFVVNVSFSTNNLTLD